MLPSTCGTNISGPSSPTTYCLSAFTGPPLANPGALDCIPLPKNIDAIPLSDISNLPEALRLLTACSIMSLSTLTSFPPEAFFLAIL
jgi:hypothetical protein